MKLSLVIAASALAGVAAALPNNNGAAATNPQESWEGFDGKDTDFWYIFNTSATKDLKNVKPGYQCEMYSYTYKWGFTQDFNNNPHVNFEVLTPKTIGVNCVDCADDLVADFVKGLSVYMKCQKYTGP